jgi:protease I
MLTKLRNIMGKNNHSPRAENRSRVLSDLHVAILATDGFEQSELFSPKEALENAGAIVHIISTRPGKIRGWNHNRWGKSIKVDMTLRQAWSMDFDAIVLPGGVMNPDRLRAHPEAIAFISTFINKQRPIAAICHGAQTLIETGALTGHRLTSWPSIKQDLINAGAFWEDKEVVIDNKLITSRRPDDLPAFNNAIIREFSFERIKRPLRREDYRETIQPL